MLWMRVFLQSVSSIAVCNQSGVEELYDAIAKLGWDCYDNVTVEIGGASVSGIDVGEEYNKKWQSPIGTRKYNKDAFIIIKNQDRRDLTKSQPFPKMENSNHIMNMKLIDPSDPLYFRQTSDEPYDRHHYKLEFNG